MAADENHRYVLPVDQGFLTKTLSKGRAVLFGPGFLFLCFCEFIYARKYLCCLALTNRNVLSCFPLVGLRL